ncbi:MAG TPA: LmeA family phospholipid-binding protein [Candidatus Limnocylindria bacterium]|nr:LmeA family phospholipid-binding protein [Candidatus Limnocylindria bacterium]
MRVLAAAVLILAAVLIGMAARGEFNPVASPAVRATARPSSALPGGVPSATGRLITVTLTEQDLTTAAQGYMPLTVSGITVTDPNIKLEPGRLTLTATGRAFIVGGPIVVVASPLVTNGAAAAKIESATFAGINLPDSTKQNVADTFARVLAANLPSGVRVTSLTVGSGSLVVEAVPG